MEKIDKAIEILQAFKENKDVINSNKVHITGPSSYIDNYEPYYKMIEKLASLQIVKEPTYRPYKNAEEFLKASKEHGPYIRYCFIHILPSIIHDNDIQWCVYNPNLVLQVATYKRLTDTDTFTWQDGTPCGVLEQ